ncbi:hypothetical protein V497_00767 [Pseudogymnoascus sp. VKM F-4516 (FW-969)]|nr:hypothetical protein V497_00767 [Pseudogymnoascus sp. VKM F-4516 (FW-969)]
MAPTLPVAYAVQAAKHGVSVLDCNQRESPWNYFLAYPHDLFMVKRLKVPDDAREILDGLAHLASIGPSTAPSVAPTFSLARRGYQDRWPGALPEVGVIRPGTRAEHKSFGEHNNGIDAEIHYT